MFELLFCLSVTHTQGELQTLTGAAYSKSGYLKVNQLHIEWSKSEKYYILSYPLELQMSQPIVSF